MRVLEGGISSSFARPPAVSFEKPMTTGRRKLRASEFAEVVAAERMAMKLASRIEEDQRQIAEQCALICPLNAASNLLDRMRALLAERRYASIKALLGEWNEWQCQCEVLVERIRETQSWINGFCAFYEETNGRL